MNFQARYDGHCSECGEPIHVGDTVTYRDHALCHEDCPDEQHPWSTHICPRCHLQLPLSGHCDCEEDA